MYTRSLQAALEAMTNEIAKQTGLDKLDNLGDNESVVIMSSEEVILNLRNIADALLAALEIEVMWEEEEEKE